MSDHEEHDHDRDKGLAFDLQTMGFNRRRVLQLLAGATLAPLLGCSTKDSPGTRTGTLGAAGMSSGGAGASSGAAGAAGTARTTIGAAGATATAGAAGSATSTSGAAGAAAVGGGRAGVAGTAAAGSAGNATAGASGDAGSAGGAGSSGAPGTTSAAGTAGRAGASSTSCAMIPEETEGPYPGDGSNGANALSESGIVRSDVRSSFGSMSGVAAGIPLTIHLNLVDVKAGCAALKAYAVYIWQCDRDGDYSLYTIKTENYLRGVQETDAAGSVSFKSIFPACYPGRWPHVHFEIYPSLAKATKAGNKLKTSQLALPVDACNAVYATPGYSASVKTLSMITIATDMVFSDGAALQIPTITGNVTDGYTITLTTGINV